MRLPIREITGNLGWATDGSVWATWRVEADSCSYLSTRARRELHARTRAALMVLGSEAMILGLCEPIDPAAVVEAMIEGVDLDAHPEWADVATWALDGLEGVTLWSRAWFLSVRLPEGGLWRGPMAAAHASVLSAFGLPAPPVGPPEVAVRARQAAEIAEQITGRLRLRAATVGELRWIYARAPRKGLDEPVMGDYWEPARADRARLAHLLPLGDVELQEGGRRDDPGRRRHRRYLRVELPDGAVGYQTFSVISEMPRKWTFPGGAGEWFSQIDDVCFPVDWCARIRPIANAEAQVKTRRQHRQLVGQIDEYESETSGPPASLANAIADIDAERSALAANPADAELQTTIVYNCWASDLDTLESRANQLAQLFGPQEYSLHRPTGGQRDLYQAMLPGSPCPQVCRDYTQYLLPADLASGAPFAGAEIGDRTGVYFANQLDGYSLRPVLLSPEPIAGRGGPRSIGLFGAPNRGKSHAAKLLIAGLLARGGQVVALDRTKLGEYKRLAKVTPGRSQVVDLGEHTDVSLVPLRVFAGVERLTYTIGFLTVLLGTAPMEHDGTVLSDAVETIIDRPDATLTDVAGALLTMTDPVAAELAGKLRKIAATPLGHIVFSQRPAVALDADYIVFAAQGLHLPSREQVLNAHLARRMLPEQMLSQALLYLVAAVTRNVTWARTDRYSLGVFDEVWGLTHTVEGHHLLEELLRDGRKHNSGVLVAGQDPGDLGNLDDSEENKLPSLIPIRLVYPFEHRAAAARGLQFLDLDSTDELIRLLSDQSAGMDIGQCLLRDAAGRVGRIQVVEAWSAELAAAMETNPARLPPESIPSDLGPSDLHRPDLDRPDLDRSDLRPELTVTTASPLPREEPVRSPDTRWVRPSRRKTLV